MNVLVTPVPKLISRVNDKFKITCFSSSTFQDRWIFLSWYSHAMIEAISHFLCTSTHNGDNWEEESCWALDWLLFQAGATAAMRREGICEEETVLENKGRSGNQEVRSALSLQIHLARSAVDVAWISSARGCRTTTGGKGQPYVRLPWGTWGRGQGKGSGSMATPC